MSLDEENIRNRSAGSDGTRNLRPLGGASAVHASAAVAGPVAGVIARNVVIARNLAGMTQHELAAGSGVSRATIAQLETGTADPRLSTIVAVSGALGVSPLVLLAGHREVTALAGLCRDLADRPVGMTDQDLARMRELVAGDDRRDLNRAARIGASVGRAAGCTSPGAAATAGLFSVVAPGRGTAVGAALGRLLG